MSGLEHYGGKSNIESFKASVGDGVEVQMDGVAMTSKRDFSDDKVENTHSYAGLMSADAYAEKRAKLIQDAGDSKLTTEELEKVKKDRDDAFKAREIAARKLREEEKKRKLKEALDDEEDEGGSKKKKKKDKKKKKKKKEALLSFDPED